MSPNPRRRRLALVSLLCCAAFLSGERLFAQTAVGGNNHSIILKSDGTVWSVGDNTNGKIGDNTTTVRKSPPYQVSGLSNVIAVAAGAQHSMALTSGGNLYLWGDNTFGQIGDNSTTARKTPVQSNLTNIVAIAAGEYQSVALKSNGDAYVWGRNNNGQVGDGNNPNNALTPQLILSGVAAIAAGFNHTIFVKTDGKVYGAGLNGNGQLGDGTTTSPRPTPVQMSGITTATAAAAGELHTVILLSSGALKATGYNGFGQIGDGTTTQRTSPVSVSTVSNITAIASGKNHVLARESDSTVWAWGRNFAGQVGDGQVPDNRTSPYEITSLSSITKIGTGQDHSIAVTSGGVVYTWGENDQFQLGDGTQVRRYTPVAISDSSYDWKVSTPTISIPGGTYTVTKTVTIARTTPDANIFYTLNGNEPTTSDSGIASGSTLTISISETLKVKAFKSGMPASNTAVETYELKVVTPTVSLASNTFATAFNTLKTTTMSTTTSEAHVHYTTDGSTPTTSSTEYLGTPKDISTTTLPLTVVGFKDGWTPSTPTTRNYYFNYGTLSAPTSDQATGSYVDNVTVTLSAMSGATIHYMMDGNTPTCTSGLTSPPALSFGVTTTLKAIACHPDYVQSSVATWTYTLAAAAPTFNPTAGTYTAGQLVTLTSPSSSSTMRYTINGVEPTTSDPVLTSGSTIVAGNFTLKAKAWKTNADASATTTAAYAINGDVAPPVLAIDGDSVLAIRSDGTAWGWGANASGQLGDGTTTSPRLLPQLVAGVTGALGLSAGGNFSHILLSGGSVVGFGGNANGRLGDGTTTARFQATTISGLSAVVAVDGGEDHGTALKGDGTVLTWGANAYGQLGQNGTTQLTSPTALSGLSSMSAISASYHYSLALKQDGTVWGWGDNSSGNLGDGSTTDRLTPTQVSVISTATKISAGKFHAVALLGDGTAVGWGANGAGQLGDGTTTQRTAPVAVALLDDLIAVAAGSDFSMALKDDGTVWTWGANSTGQLGDGTTTARSSAEQVSGLTDIVQIVAGEGFAVALASDASVWAWGRNNLGQLGDGTTANRLTPVQIAGTGMNWRVATPTLSLASGQYFATQSVTVTIADPNATLRYTTTGVDPISTDATVTSGGSISIDVSKTLKVSGWKTGAPTSVVVARAYELKAVTPSLSPGAGAYGSSQSVTISTTTSGATLRYTTDGTEPTSSSTQYTSALTIGDTVTLKARAFKSGWTNSDSGYAGYSISSGTVATPSISPTGGTQTTPPLVAITTSTAGATIRYTLDGTTPTLASPVFVYPFVAPVTTTVKAKAFKSGYTASATATTTYDVDASGATATPLISPFGGTYAIAKTVTITGASGATLRYTTDGTDPTTSSTSITSGNTISVEKSQVVKVRAWASGLDPSAVRRGDFVITGAIAAGENHSMALTSAGAVKTWGAGGVIGDGNTTADLTPVQVLTGGAAIAMGVNHALVAKADGSVWSWGDATSGRLGNGGVSGFVTTPAQISSFGSVIAVATGTSHSLALKSDGTVWSFGENDHGQIGDGSTTNRTTPVQVVGLTGIVQIAAGRDTSYALQTDSAGSGIVWAWGTNSQGELGDGSLMDRTTPVRVVGLSNVEQISSSPNASHALALLADGTVFGWGLNDRAQLGIGNLTIQSTPQQVASLVHVRAVAAGGEHAVAMDATSRVWGWGDNTGGQLAKSFSDSAASIVPERSDLAGALLFAAGTSHTLTAAPDGSLRAVGSNGGRLGNGGTTQSASAVVVSGLTLADNTWLTSDADEDGLETWREYLLGTDPLNPDSNGNGILDGLDDASNLSATNPDVDGDGVPNWIERLNGTDPFRADSDGDSVTDLNDAFPLDPTRSMAPSSNPSDTTPPMVTLKEPVSARLITP